MTPSGGKGKNGRKGKKHARRRQRRRARVRQILIKLREGKRLEQVETRDGEVRLLYGGEELTEFDSLLTPDRQLRQSFPEVVAYALERFGPRALEPNAYSRHSLDLFLRLTLLDPGDDLPRLLSDVRQVAVVELAREVAPLAGATSAPLDYADPSADPSDTTTGHQGYLVRGARNGVDARYAWEIGGPLGAAGASGSGGGVHVCLLDPGLCTSHPNIPDIPAVRTYGASDEDEAEHGAMVLGVLGAPHDGGDGTPGGTIGICRNAVFHYCGTEPKSGATGDMAADVAAVLPTAIVKLPDFSVLLIETEIQMLETWKPVSGDVVFWDSSTGKGRGRVPVEVNEDVRGLLIFAAVMKKITVVEAAGNSGGQLGEIVDTTSGDVVWDPPPSGSDDSLAVMVGSGYWETQKYLNGNHGPRVSCQGWGGNVWAPVCPPDVYVYPDTPLAVTGGDNCYTPDFNSTSSATAIVGGIVACIQGAMLSAHGVPLPPWQIRNLLSSVGLGRPQPVSDPNHIGPLPDLYRILCHLGIGPDLYLRDHLYDLGTPQPFLASGALPFFWNRSPDLVIRPGAIPVLDASNWMTEIPSARVELKNNVAIRVKNLDRGPDSGRYQLWWAPPASFLHPRWWMPIDGGSVPLTAGGKVHSEEVVWSTLAHPLLAGHPVALIGALWPHRNLVESELRVPATAITPPVTEKPTVSPVAAVRTAMSTLEFRQLLAASNDIACRSVQWESGHPGDTLNFEYHLIGVPEGPASFRLELTSDLPPKTQVSVTPHPALDSTTVPAIHWTEASPYNGFLRTGSAGFDLGMNEVIFLQLAVTLPAGIAPGTYETSIDQYLGTASHLGRITFIVTVLPPPIS